MGAPDDLRGPLRPMEGATITIRDGRGQEITFPVPVEGYFHIYTDDYGWVVEAHGLGAPDVVNEPTPK